MESFRFHDFTSEILKNLAAEDSSNSKSDAVEGWWTKSKKRYDSTFYAMHGMYGFKTPDNIPDRPY